MHIEKWDMANHQVWLGSYVFNELIFDASEDTTKGVVQGYLNHDKIVEICNDEPMVCDWAGDFMVLPVGYHRQTFDIEEWALPPTT